MSWKCHCGLIRPICLHPMREFIEPATRGMPIARKGREDKTKSGTSSGPTAPWGPSQYTSLLQLHIPQRRYAFHYLIVRSAICTTAGRQLLFPVLCGGLPRFYCCENSTGLIVMPIGKLPCVAVKVSRLLDDDPKFAVSQVHRHEGIRFPSKDFRLYESPLASCFEADTLPDREPCSKTDDNQYACDRYP
jgi:hypothetical protein